MIVGLSYDLKDDIEPGCAAADDYLEEYDSRETVELIAGSLKTIGHTVTMLGGGREFIENVLRQPVDLVFNIAEGRGNYRSREAQVPAILELLGIPYTGSDPLCLAACLDKPMAKKLVALEGVPTPHWSLIQTRSDIEHACRQVQTFPLIAKPAFEGSSKGIRLASVIENADRAREEITRIYDNYRQPVMVEEFIDGDEVTVGVTGNLAPRVLGIMRILPKNKNGHFVYSLEVKRDYKNRVVYECPANLSPGIAGKISDLAVKVFRVLGCRDFARMDFRIGPDNAPYFIEVNPLPGLGSHSDLYLMALMLGWTHEKLVKSILDAALERYPRWVLA